MEAVAAAVGQAPVMRDFRRNVASTVIILTLGTLLVAGGVDWSYRGISNWAYNKANTNISLPLTSWQLEVRMRWVKAAPSLDGATQGPASIHEYFDAHPLRTKLYSVGLMCSPRWALLWAWLFDREPGLLLLHQHVAQHQANVMYYVRGAMQYIMPGLLPLSSTEAAADSSPIMQLLYKIFQLNSSLLFWVAWLLCPGLQSAYYTLFFTSQAPIKTLYGVLIGVTRTAVECRAVFKCTQAAMKRDQQLVRNSLLCCYALPFIMTLQSMSALLVLGLVVPHWILHICVVAFCLWGPPAMIALMTTAWQPDRHRPLLVDAPMGVVEGAPPGGAVDAMAAFIANNNIRGQAASGKASQDAVYWPKPLVVPEAVEEQCSIPHYFICSITHSIMLEPAVTATGATYERGAIMEWLRTQKRDPLTGRELRPEQVSPNLALYRAIDEWIHASQEQLKRHKHQHEQQPQQQQHGHHHRHAANHHSNQSGYSDRSSSATGHSKCEKGKRRQNLGSRRGSMEAGASSSPTAAVVDQLLSGQE